MKKLFTLLAAVTLSAMLFAQAPQSFSYQTVIRDASWQVLSNQNISLEISIIEDVANGTAIYTESHSATTNELGLVNLSIGDGGVMFGSWSNIDWGNHTYFIEVAVDVTGGTSYIVMGTTQLRSVPYALYAETSGSMLPGPQGLQGIQGLPGDTGATGAQGPIGLTGPAGANGIDGTNGVDGNDGADGQDGAPGQDGSVGATGSQGIQGPAGNDGADGQDGIDGVDGAVGSTGPIGLTGATGLQGAQGIQGPAGVDGDDGQDGQDGPPGQDGAVGATGAQGIQGVPGNDGVVGAQGPIGLTGATGLQGAQGIQGLPGNDGQDGTNGVDGIDGIDGIDAVVDYDSLANLISVDSSFTANVSGGIGGGCDFKYPDGLDGEAITQTVTVNQPYTVPTGKRLYINYGEGYNAYLKIDGITIIHNLGHTEASNIALPIVANSGQVVSVASNDCSFNGFLADANTSIEAVTQTVTVNQPYTVPTGKRLYINYGEGYNAYLKIDGITIIHNLGHTSASHIALPIVANSGQVVSVASNDCSFNGYLADENYFAGCGGGGSSSSSAMPSGTNVGEMMFWDGTDWLVVAPPSVVFSNPPSLMFVNGAPTWSTPVLGCTDSLAANYNYLANINDSSCIAMAMGVYHKGGIVIWLDSTGQHGLICDIKDMGSYGGSVTWGCSGTVTGASGIAIGTGQQNTIDILANCNVSGTAADLCVNSSAQGYTDWFLPSKYELHQIYINRIAVDEISLLYGGNVLTSGTDYLWSSSENTANEAWYEKIDAGIYWSASKGVTINVRAVRAF